MAWILKVHRTPPTLLIYLPLLSYIDVMNGKCYLTLPCFWIPYGCSRFLVSFVILDTVWNPVEDCWRPVKALSEIDNCSSMSLTGQKVITIHLILYLAICLWKNFLTALIPGNYLEHIEAILPERIWLHPYLESNSVRPDGCVIFGGCLLSTMIIRWGEFMKFTCHNWREFFSSVQKLKSTFIFCNPCYHSLIRHAVFLNICFTVDFKQFAVELSNHLVLRLTILCVSLPVTSTDFILSSHHSPIFSVMSNLLHEMGLFLTQVYLTFPTILCLHTYSHWNAWPLHFT